jgi:hypothetical protein
MYGAETSPCNVGEYVANVQAGDGYYLDPGVNGGWCKTVPAANVETVREDIGTDNWQSHATGVTYLPRSASASAELVGWAAFASGAGSIGGLDYEAVVTREQQIGGSGVSLEPPRASFLNPLGLFSRTSMPFI